MNRYAAPRWAFVALAFIPFGVAPAFADCQTDMGKLMAERQSTIEALNKLSQNSKKQLDPIAACPKLKNLTALENKVVSYLEKNKDWCNVPDNFVENAKTSRAKTGALAAKACQVAAQVEKMKKMQQQQAQGGGPQVQKLPAGPL